MLQHTTVRARLWCRLVRQEASQDITTYRMSSLQELVIDAFHFHVDADSEAWHTFRLAKVDTNVYFGVLCHVGLVHLARR